MAAVEQIVFAWRGGALRSALGRVIRQRRRAKQLSQRELAFDSGLARNYISLVELGSSSPTVDSLSQIANALDESPSSLLAQAEGLQARGSVRRRKR
jgi:transcriptional regulator with XRE-family HTH domain